MKKEFLLLSFFLLFILSELILSQSSGKLTGKIMDASTGEPVAFANVVLEGTNFGAASDMDGDYLIVNVPSGTYNIIVSYIGYVKVVTQNVKVHTDLTTKIDFTLTPTSVSLQQEIVIIAKTPLIKKDLTSTESRITADEIEGMPLQNLDQLISLQAGYRKV